jgi:hypothetical protein
MGVSDDAAKASGVRATLVGWRERGADRLNPVRFRFIEALERRAAAHSGEAGRILDDRLAGLVEAYAQDLERAALCDASAASVIAPSSRNASVPGSLAELNGYIANQSQAVDDLGPRPHAYPELDLLDYFREVWSKLSAESQLRQSLEQVPGNAGPLNSSSLVHRSLSLMRELSPGYLQQFLSYVEALSWMEQINGGGSSPGKETSPARSPRKSTRINSR